jgi:hypothetical protein
LFRGSGVRNENAGHLLDETSEHSLFRWRVIDVVVVAIHAADAIDRYLGPGGEWRTQQCRRAVAPKGETQSQAQAQSGYGETQSRSQSGRQKEDRSDR